MTTSRQISQVYEVYPKKTARGAAEKAIAKALQEVRFDTLIEAVQAYAEAVAQWPKADHRFIPNPATWFNQKRWEDDRETWKRTGNGKSSPFAAPVRVPTGDYSKVKVETL